MASFDARAPSFGPMQAQYPPGSYVPAMAAQVHSNGLQHPPVGYRPYEEAQPQRQPIANHGAPAQIYTAVYSSVAVYEMEVNGVAVMKRRSDSWLNATQILKVAGVEKGKRTKILEKEILTGQHEKVQGGYGRYQGTWINYQRGREFCRQYHVEELLRPLLEYDMGSDGMGSSGQVDTPTKEQAMAANRKRFYNTSIDGRLNGQLSGNTFFQNISPTASNALAAMNKAARFDSPQPRPSSGQRRPPALARQLSHQQLQSQDSNFPGGSQQSIQSFASDHDMNGIATPQFGALGTAPMYGRIEASNGDAQEPPRKRVKASSQDMYGHVDPSLQDGILSQSQASTVHHHYIDDGINGPQSLPPLSSPKDKAGEEKRAMLMDLFADLGNSSRTDFSTHPAVAMLSNEDLDIPLDDITGNTALHWAATLSKVALMKQLIGKGANIFRGNAAGQTPLMSAVQVNNTFDHGCFPEMLELIGPLIELRDATGRTVLHHIALSSGIKGRAISSRYYLESLLEFVVRQGGSIANSQQTSFDSTPNKPKSIGLVKFMSDVVNVQDKSGNTALNLVARIGNRAIINQLDELGADYNIANHSNVRPLEFGIYPRGQGIIAQALSNQLAPSSQTKPPSQVEQIRDELIATAQSILSQTHSQYTTELSKSQSHLDHQNASLRSIATAAKTEQDRLDTLQARAKDRSDRARKIANLRRSIAEQQMRAQQRGSPVSRSASSSQEHENTVLSEASAHKIEPDALPSSPSPSASSDAQKAYLSSLPAAPVLRARLAAYSSNNAALEAKLTALKGRSSELEAQYRRVVALCTGTEESRVEGVLELLVAAVESEDAGEGGGGVDVGRVREFLRKVEGVEA